IREVRTHASFSEALLPPEEEPLVRPTRRQAHQPGPRREGSLPPLPRAHGCPEAADPRRPAVRCPAPHPGARRLPRLVPEAPGEEDIRELRREDQALPRLPRRPPHEA